MTGHRAADAVDPLAPSAAAAGADTGTGEAAP